MILIPLSSQMATNKVINDVQKLDSSGALGDGDSATQVRIIQVPAKCGAKTAMKHPFTAASNSRSESVTGLCKVIPSIQEHQHTSSGVPGPLTSHSSVMLIAKTATPGRVSIQFNSVLFIYRQITTHVISRHLNNIVQFKPIGVHFIVIIIQ